jgi:hypothetical protein
MRWMAIRAGRRSPTTAADRRWPICGAWVWLLPALLVACSSSGGGKGTGGAAGGPNAAAGHVASGAAGSGGGSGGAPAGTGGHGGSAGAPADAGSAGASGTITCNSNQQRLAGTLAGDTLALNLTGRVVDVSQSPWLLLGLADQGELFALQGLTNGDPLSAIADPSNELAFYGLLATPRTAPSNGRIYCIGAGRASGDGDHYTAHVTVDSASTLGQCPGGVAVAGSLDFCTSGLGTCHTLEGTLDGVSIQISSFTNAESASEYMAYSAQIAVRFLMADGQPVTNGLIWSPTAGLLAGGVYCIGGGSCAYETVDGGPETLARCTLTQFSKVGTCGSGVGSAASAAGCVRGTF